MNTKTFAINEGKYVFISNNNLFGKVDYENLSEIAKSIYDKFNSNDEEMKVTSDESYLRKIKSGNIELFDVLYLYPYQQYKTSSILMTVETYEQLIELNLINYENAKFDDDVIIELTEDNVIGLTPSFNSKNYPFKDLIDDVVSGNYEYNEHIYGFYFEKSEPIISYVHWKHTSKLNDEIKEYVSSL